MEELANKGLPQTMYFLGDKDSGISNNMRVAYFEKGRNLVMGINGENQYL